ncbi:MAG: AAA family ATPase [Phycisphaerae bacterium]|nr:AAA family ATPase [Phycisphaerae bacterium]
MRTIAVVNEKGGTGKTTTAVNLAAALGQAGHKTLLVDLDGQAAASRWLGVEEDNRLADALLRGGGLEPLANVLPGVSLAPASGKLDSVAHDLRPTQGGQLRRVLTQLRDEYEYVLIDCPPSLGNRLIGNALLAASEALVPVEPSVLALDGLRMLLTTLQDVRDGFEHRIDLLGVVVCRFETRTRLSRLVLAELNRALPGHVFDATVRETVRMQECPASDESILTFAPDCNAAADYMTLAGELAAGGPAATVGAHADEDDLLRHRELTDEDRNKVLSFRQKAAAVLCNRQKPQPVPDAPPRPQPSEQTPPVSVAPTESNDRAPLTSPAAVARAPSPPDRTVDEQPPTEEVAAAPSATEQPPDAPQTDEADGDVHTPAPWQRPRVRLLAGVSAASIIVAAVVVGGHLLMATQAEPQTADAEHTPQAQTSSRDQAADPPAPAASLNADTTSTARARARDDHASEAPGVADSDAMTDDASGVTNDEPCSIYEPRPLADAASAAREKASTGPFEPGAEPPARVDEASPADDEPTVTSTTPQADTQPAVEYASSDRAASPPADDGADAPPADEPLSPDDAARARWRTATVSCVLRGPGGPVAMINDEMVAVGQRVGDGVIMGISAVGVEIDFDGQTRTVGVGETRSVAAPQAWTVRATDAPPASDASPDDATPDDADDEPVESSVTDETAGDNG